MNSKQNLVFFIGLTLIIMVFWVNGYWTILKNGIFVTKPSSNSGPPNEVKPSKGQCPPGYIKVGNMCLLKNANLPPALM